MTGEPLFASMTKNPHRLMMKRLFQWLVRYFRKGEARYYVNDFLKSPNGISVVGELTETEIMERKALVETLLLEDWLPNQKKLHQQVDFTIKYLDQLDTRQTLAELFDAPLRLPFDWYQAKEVEDLIHVQVMTALGLSGQLHEKNSNLYIVIIEHERAIFETMSAIRYKVCHVFDWGRFANETVPVPPYFEKPIPEYV